MPSEKGDFHTGSRSHFTKGNRDPLWKTRATSVGDTSPGSRQIFLALQIDYIKQLGNKLPPRTREARVHVRRRKRGINRYLHRYRFQRDIQLSTWMQILPHGFSPRD